MNTTVAVKEQRQAMATVGEALSKMKSQFEAVLPKHITPERLTRVALVAIQNQPKLLECNRNSLYLAILRAAQLGLEPDGILGQAYLIPYGKDVQFIPGYKGLIDLARRSGEVSNIIAKEVCENDLFEVDYSLEIPFVHKPLLKGERGEVTHFWALAKFKDGGFHWDYMSRAEVEAIRDGSSGYKNAKKYPKNGVIISPWEQNFVEMGKKTAIRRIAKYLPMSVQKATTYEALQDSGHKVDFEGGDLIIDNADDGTIIDSDTGEIHSSNKLEQFSGEDQTMVTGPSPAALQALAEKEAKLAVKPVQAQTVTVAQPTAETAAPQRQLSEAEMNAIDAEEAKRDEEKSGGMGFVQKAAALGKTVGAA